VTSRYIVVHSVVRLDYSIAAFVIVVCSIKMFRSAFTNPAHQFLIVIFTMLFFRYDCPELTESFLVDYFFVSILLNKASGGV